MSHWLIRNHDFQVNFPLPWHPRIVSISTIWLADLLILGVPGEPTTMSGRRMRRVVGDVMRAGGFEEKVVVSGLTNEYIHYVATREEYWVRRLLLKCLYFIMSGVKRC